MTEPTRASHSVAAVCDKHSPDAARMDAYLREQGLSARWYALRDLDDVDREVCAGRTQQVVFLNWSDLLQGMWNREVSFDQWLKMQAEVRFVEAPGDTSAACLAAVSEAWSAHKRARRRRQAISGLILSLVAVAAAFAIVQF